MRWVRVYKSWTLDLLLLLVNWTAKSLLPDSKDVSLPRAVLVLSKPGYTVVIWPETLPSPQRPLELVLTNTDSPLITSSPLESTNHN